MRLLCPHVVITARNPGYGGDKKSAAPLPQSNRVSLSSSLHSQLECGPKERVLQFHPTSPTADRESSTTALAPEACKVAMHLKVVALEDARVFWISLGPGAPAAVFVPTAFALVHASAAVAVSAVAAPSAVFAPDLRVVPQPWRPLVRAAAAIVGAPVPAVRAVAPALAAAFCPNWG